MYYDIVKQVSSIIILCAESYVFGLNLFLSCTRYFHDAVICPCSCHSDHVCVPTFHPVIDFSKPHMDKQLPSQWGVVISQTIEHQNNGLTCSNNWIFHNLPSDGTKQLIMTAQVCSTKVIKHSKVVLQWHSYCSLFLQLCLGTKKMMNIKTWSVPTTENFFLDDLITLCIINCSLRLSLATKTLQEIFSNAANSGNQVKVMSSVWFETH